MEKIDWKAYEMTDGDGAGVYCGTYKKYNNGSLYGAWLDMKKFDDAEEFFAVCASLHEDEEDPEFMFQDFQGFPESMYSESMSAEEIQSIIDFVWLDKDEQEILEDYSELYCTKIDVNSLQEAKEKVVGYGNLHDFLTQEAENMLAEFESTCKYEYDCKGAAHMIEKLANYFDYEAYYEANRHYYSEGSNGYIFYDC